MLTSARSRHAEDTKWLRKFEAQWGRQDRSEAPVLPRAMCALPRTGTRATRRQQAEEIVAREGSRRWGARQAVGGFAFVRRVHLLTANYVRNGYVTYCCMYRLRDYAPAMCLLGSLPRAYYVLGMCLQFSTVRTGTSRRCCTI